MEESVTKKLFVHEDSGSVTLFCGKFFVLKWKKSWARVAPV